MRKVMAILVVLAMCAGIFSVPVLAGASAGVKSTARDEATEDGLYWCNDKRLTDNPSEDRIPQIVVDSTGISHVVWFRGSSYSGQYMYKKIDRLGSELIAEKQICTGSIPEQYSGFQSPSIAIDSKGCFHLCYEPGGYGVAYAKYDANGNNLVPQKTVPSGASSPHNPSIAVSKNDIAHVIYEDYRFGYGAEAITYARIKCADGEILKDGVRISDPGWYCEGSCIAADPFNNVHVSFINTAQGVFHGKLDNQGNPLPQAPPTSLYTTGQFWSHGPPYIGCDGLGGIHIIWNSAGGAAVGNTLYLKLDNNGNKLTPEPITLATGTCKGFPYIQGDSRGNAYAIWSDTRNGGSDIFYVKIENGKENDTQLPNKAICLTKAHLGQAMEPKLAMDPDDNLHVTWKDNRDGNYEIYYKFAFNYGVEVTMSPEEMYKVMYVHPNETKSANITIRNTGGLNDTVSLNLSVNFHDHLGWKVKVENMSFVMKPQEVKKLKISVTGPPEGTLNDYIDSKVIAVSEGNSRRNSTVGFRTYLTVDERLTMTCSDRIHSTQAGVPTSYQLFVSNIGDIKIDVNLTWAGPPEWEVALERNEIKDLRPGKGFNFTLTVTPPVTAMADEVGMVSVTAKSVKNQGVKDTVVTHTVVSPSIFIELACPEPEKRVDPGNSTSYEIFISNVGNMAGTVIIILEIVSGTGSWHAELDANAVGVAGMETKSITMTVISPSDARAGDRLVIRVVGYNEQKTMTDDVTVTTMVNQVHRILISATPEKQVADPGATVTYTVTVQNGGNGPEELSLSVAKLEVNWKLKYVMGNAEITDIYLDPASPLSFEVVVTVPPDALCGDHIAAISLLDSSKAPWTADLVINVRHIFDIDLTTTLSKQLGTPGRTLYFSVLTKNKGNGLDTISFATSKLPSGWTYVYKDQEFATVDSITLNASDIGKTSLLITLPLTANATSQEILVTGTSESGLTDTIKFVVDMMLPDLYLTSVAYSPKSVKAGKAATVTVTVVNKGEVNVENVTIRFLDGTTILGTEKLERLPSNSNKTATFTWVPRSGQHSLKFVVDPENSIIESDEKNNVMKDSMNIRGGGLEMLPGFEPLLAVFAIALAAVGISFRRKR